MKISYSFEIASSGLKNYKVRSFLAMLGIIIGVAAVITMISMGESVQDLILGQITSLGSNNIFVKPGAPFEKMKGKSNLGAMAGEQEIKTLKYSDALAIKKIPFVEEVVPLVMGTDRIVYKEKSEKVGFMGATPDVFKVRDSKFILGSSFSEGDVKSMAKKIVLGYKIKEDLFGDQNPVGKIVRIKKTNFRVVGVLEEQGTEAFMNLDEQVYIPITTAQKILLGINYVRWIIVKSSSEDRIDEVVYNIRSILRDRHGIYNPENDLSKDDFNVMSQKQAADVVTNITNTFTFFLAAIAAIALIVGGIGILNIMLVSVTERTREIGLRKAVGAEKKDILLQFLLEALILTIVGGIIGILLGIVFSFIGESFLMKTMNVGAKWNFFVSLKAILLGFGVSTIIGLVFGVYPARKASELSPIEALRYE